MDRYVSLAPFLGVFIFLCVVSQAWAQDANRTISFQGFLTDDLGDPLTDVVSITFKLYLPPSANPEWTEVHPSVSVVDGRFDVELGSIVDLNDLSFERDVELGVSVDGDPEISPRTFLTGVPNAMNLRGALRVQVVDDEVGTQVFDADNIIGGNGWVDPAAVGVTISGGGNSDDFATKNRGYGDYGTIGGGVGNAVGGNDGLSTTPEENPYATVAGGRYNEAVGAFSAIGGGYSNLATGTYATVPGGFYNEANGRYSLAAGYLATSNHRGAYVWSDSSGSTFTSTADWQYLIRARGGVGIGTAYPSRTLTLSRPSQSASYQVEVRNQGNITAGNYDGVRFTQADTPSSTPTNLAWIKVPYQSFGGADMEFGLRYHDEPILYLKNMGNVGGTPVRVGIGTSSPSAELQVNGNIDAVVVNQSSDARLKRDVTELSAALEAVLSLHGVRFFWDRESHPERAFSDRAQLGFLAQEVRDVVPEVVSEDDDGMLSVAYANLVPLLVEAIKEQNARIARLENALVEMRGSQ